MVQSHGGTPIIGSEENLFWLQIRMLTSQNTYSDITFFFDACMFCSTQNTEAFCSIQVPKCTNSNSSTNFIDCDNHQPKTIKNLSIDHPSIIVRNYGGKCSTSIEGKLDGVDFIPLSILLAVSLSCSN